MSLRTTSLAAALAGLALAGLAPAVPAAAQTRPAVFPTRDVTVDYHIDGTLPLPVRDIRVQAPAGAERLRIEQPDRLVLLVNRPVRRVLMLLTAQRTTLSLPWPKEVQQGLDMLARARFVRQGSDSQAGVPCTIYDVSADGRHALACLTADGVLLRADGVVRSKSANGSYHLAATMVSYAPLDPAIFSAPPGTTPFKLPSFAK